MKNRERSRYGTPLLLRYLRSVWKYGAALCLSAAVFGVISFLQGMDAGNVLYALLLILAVGFGGAFFGYLRFKKRHMTLLNFLSEIGASVGELPAGHGLEEDCRAIVLRLSDELSRTVSDADAKMSGIRDYYAMWAHQIKTPIAAMRLLLQSGDGQTERDAELRHELFRIEEYVGMVLTYIRSDSDSTDYVIADCALDGIVRQCVRKYAPSFIRRRINLHYEPEKATVLTDEKWLTFAVEQIISNALKYTGEGGDVSISCRQGDTDRDLILSVRDTGIGIRPEDLPRVFENGYTGYNGRQERKSTGIGLYLTKRVLNKLGHGIFIMSELGKGTTVEIVFSKVALTFE